MKCRLSIILALAALGLFLGQSLESSQSELKPIHVTDSPYVFDTSGELNTEAELRLLNELSDVEEEAIYRASLTRNWDAGKEHAEKLLALRESALEIALDSQSNKHIVRQLYRLSRAHAQNGDFAQAEAHLKAAFERCETEERRRDMRELLFALYERFAQWESALAILDEAIDAETTPHRRQSLRLDRISLLIQEEKLTQAETELATVMAEADSGKEDDRSLSILERCWGLKARIYGKNDDEPSERTCRIQQIEYQLRREKAKPLGE